MNKRGQFYLIIAIVIAVAAFAITSRPNEVKEAVLFEDFEDVTNNYITESQYVVNNALETESNVETSLDTFTIEYLKYARQRSPDLQLLYVYSNGDQRKIYNYFDDSTPPSEDLPLGAQQELVQNVKILVGNKEFTHKVPVKAENFGSGWYSAPVPHDFDLSVGGFIHNFDLSGSGPELKVLINLPSGPEEFTYNPGGQDYEFQYSPAPEDQIVTNQVKTR